MCIFELKYREISTFANNIMLIIKTQKVTISILRALKANLRAF